MSFVAVDLGASSTRYASEKGRISILPNNTVIVDRDDVINLEPYSNEVESALDISIQCSTPSSMFPVRALIGELAYRHSASNIRPSVMANKYKQQINYISAITAVAVSKLTQDIDDEIDLYIALPPAEVNKAKDTLRSVLVGSYEIEFPLLNRTVKFSIKNVECFEESFLALLSYFFNMNGTPRDAAKKLATGHVMSMDIGASTTDLAIVSDMRYLEKSGQTYKTGVNIAREIIANDIRTEYGFDATDEQTDVVMSEGRLQMGNNFVDMGSYVNDAKEQFAQQITTQIQNYFRTVNIPIQSIRAIVVSGGGSMHSEYINDDGENVVTSKPIAEFITDKLRFICPGVDVFMFSDNPRLANITGLFIRASIDVAKRRKLEAQKQVQSDELAKPEVAQVQDTAVIEQ